VLVDSNVILRSLQPRSAQHETARAAFKRLHDRQLYVAPQNLIEIWAVATRPEGENGLGFTTEQAAAELTRLKTLFTMLAEKPEREIYTAWEALVTAHQVSGKQAHDARLVAAMKVYGINSILTFNTGDFARYPDIEVVHPADVVPASS
jgi:predicted nucleic acid-binding protein